ncbi:GNAT family N-acetyltransferase [Thalassospira sp. CH_XMU1448-2]|uniref:GNAT family N-acetyltransferase n=1 Tax=Thalassospira sp. CH_XMU1448-2 TaxID=3107773 RepID=UPI00300A58D8
MSEPILIRRVQPGDLNALISLVSDHVSFEKARLDREMLSDRLPTFIFGDAPRAIVFVALCGDAIVGYLSASAEFSTWNACEYLHMDCLYLTAACRGRGTGRLLMAAAAQYANANKLGWMEWQTPDWNNDAIRFYERQGALGKSKVRFSIRTEQLSTGLPEPVG